MLYSRLICESPVLVVEDMCSTSKILVNIFIHRLDLPIWYQLPMIHGRRDCLTFNCSCMLVCEINLVATITNIN